MARFGILNPANWGKKDYTVEVIQSPLQDVENVTVRQRSGARIVTQITERQIFRAKQDIQKWRSATQTAESKFTPNRLELYRIYIDTVLDPHLSGIMRVHKAKIIGSTYQVVGPDGKVDEEDTAKIRTEWFRKLLSFQVDTRYWGHTLVQLGNIIDDKFVATGSMIDPIEVVPRENVTPDFHVVKQEPNIVTPMDGIDYTKPPYDRWLIEFGDRFDFGFLHKLTPIVIWKKNVIGAWSQHAHLFGMPTRIGRTSINDPDKRRNMETMLTNMGKAAWGVFDEDDKLEFIKDDTNDVHDIYKEFIETMNSEISKMVFGQTMTTEDGSSLSQAKVHENIFDSMMQFEKIITTDQVNDRVFPKLKDFGMIKPGNRFEFNNEEQLTKLDQLKVLEFLSGKFDLDREEVEATFGFKLEDKETFTPDQFENPTSAVVNLMKLYAPALEMKKK